MSTPVLMPALWPTMTEGKLAKWHVKVGDAVKSGQMICEIETDKATMEVEAVDEGTVAQILVQDSCWKIFPKLDIHLSQHCHRHYCRLCYLTSAYFQQ